LTQRAILPSVIVGDSAGISTWLDIQLLGIISGTTLSVTGRHPYSLGL
jgi:hypothetical protein